MCRGGRGVVVISMDNGWVSVDRAHEKAYEDGIALTECAAEWWSSMVDNGSVYLRDGRQSLRAGFKEIFPCSRLYAEVSIDSLADEAGLVGEVEACQEHGAPLPDHVYDALFDLLAQKVDKHLELENDEL